MSHPSRETYLESKVFTASQPQLHIMLLDGALRFGKQAQDAWSAEGGFSAAEEPLTRMFDIVEELLQGLASGEGDFSVQFAEQYAFMYRELAACRINQDSKKLESCLELLAYQRETWKLACDRLESETTTVAKPMTPHMTVDTGVPTAGFSFEA